MEMKAVNSARNCAVAGSQPHPNSLYPVHHTIPSSLLYPYLALFFRSFSRCYLHQEHFLNPPAWLTIPLSCSQSTWILLPHIYPSSYLYPELMWIKSMSDVMAVFTVPTTKGVLWKCMFNQCIYKWGWSTAWNLTVLYLVLDTLGTISPFISPPVH